MTTAPFNPGRPRRAWPWTAPLCGVVLAAVQTLLLALLPGAAAAQATDLPEYRLKAAFMYNFALFTEWPTEVGNTLNLCIHGPDPFGKDIDELHGKAAGARTIAVQRKAAGEPLGGCHLVFIASGAIGQLGKVIESLRGLPVLTLADSPGAGGQVIINMAVAQNKISFQANLRAARSARLNLSSKLLRLATEVQQ